MTTENHLIGKQVRITWLNEWGSDANDGYWHNYMVKDICTELRMILLAGMPEDGAKFTGPNFWVPIERIGCIELPKESA
jgi:hypothetical protein